MLIVTKEKMQLLQRIREEKRSNPALCRHLQQNYSHTRVGELTDEALAEQVKQAVAIARSYGLRSKNDIYGFVTLEVTQCPGFHQHPEVQKILQDDKAHPNMRMQWLALKLPAKVWAEVS